MLLLSAQYALFITSCRSSRNSSTILSRTTTFSTFVINLPLTNRQLPVSCGDPRLMFKFLRFYMIGNTQTATRSYQLRPYVSRSSSFRVPFLAESVLFVFSRAEAHEAENMPAIVSLSLLLLDTRSDLFGPGRLPGPYPEGRTPYVPSEVNICYRTVRGQACFYLQFGRALPPIANCKLQA